MGLFSKNKKQSVPKTNLPQKQVNRNAEEAAIQSFSSGLIDIKDIIAPSAIEVDFNNLLIGSKFFRTYFVTGYPRFVGPNWLSPLINFDHPIDITTYYYPVDRVGYGAFKKENWRI